jgi:hypothetical protein
MTELEKILAKMSAAPKGVRFSELYKVCEHFLALLDKVVRAMPFSKRLGPGIPV